MDTVKPRLLLVADHCVPTGFARVSENICVRLQKEWDLAVVGLNYDGSPHNYPYRIWPARAGGDIWGLNMYQRLLHELKPDAALVINDPWIVRQFAEIDRGETPLAAYMPVDARNIPGDHCQVLNRLDLAIFYTEFGRHEIEMGGYQGPVKVIPHGVDVSIYRPLDRDVAREGLGVPKGAFVVGNVNRNQPRKRLDLTVECFAEWVHRYRLPANVLLYIHCAQRDAGWNLAQLGHYYGLAGRMLLPATDVVTPNTGLREEEMPWVYNSFDVQMTTTTGEGWGLSQIEGMACGVPQIVPQYSGLGEWAAGAALFVQCTGSVAHIGINTIGGVPDKLETVNALHRLYTNADLRREYAEKALVRAREPRFKWPAIADLFQCYLGQMLIDARARANERAAQKPQEEVQLASTA